MSLQSKPYYWVRCDGCGTDIEYGDFSAYREQDQALDGARDQNWTGAEGKHHCDRCPPLTKCEECGKDAGEGAGERDDCCAGCWAKADAETAGAS